METDDKHRATISAEPCTCVKCGMCHGNSYTSTYTRNQFDWDTETCEDCGGSGITETCDRCQLLGDMDYEDWGM